MASVRRQRGIKPSEAEKPPPLPRAAAPIWRVFRELHCTRAGGFGPGPITYTEIEAYMRVMCTPLLPWEIQALRQVDNAYLQSLIAPETGAPAEGQGNA